MIVIDPSKGGREIGVTGNGIVEKDYTLLISEYIYNRLKELGADVKIIRTDDEYISEDDRANRIINAYGNNDKVVALSNRLKNDSDGAEIIYALRNKSTLASLLSENLEDAGLNVSKYYQRRSENDTSKDYYNIQKDTGVIETIIVNYGNVDNINEATNIKNEWEDYAEAIVKTLANYQGIPYFEGDNIYVVQKGDSLWKVAQKFNTTVDKLKEENNLKTNSLSVGQTLKIPITEVSSNETYIVQQGDSLWKIANKFNTTVDNLKKINSLTNNLLQVGQVLKIESTSNNNNDNIYIVQKGDSLYTIAQKFNITTDELKNYNNLTSNLLQVGQTLKIPTINKVNTYIVKRGDSLYSIASAYNIAVEDLKKLNNLTSNLLQVGQTLIIPSNKNENYTIYTVKKGDNLYSIANTYNTTVTKIKDLNGLTNNLLQIGEQLKIPN